MIKINPKFKICEDSDEVKQFKTDIIDLSSHYYRDNSKENCDNIIYICLSDEYFESGYTAEFIKDAIKEAINCGCANHDNAIYITKIPFGIKNNHIVMTAFELCGFVPLDGIYKDALKMIYVNEKAYPVLDANAKMYLSDNDPGLGMHNRFYVPSYDDGSAIINIDKEKDTRKNIINN